MLLLRLLRQLRKGRGPQRDDGVKILDLNEAWRKSRKPGPMVNGLATFDPNWPQGEGLSAGLVDMLTKCQAQYRKHEATV